MIASAPPSTPTRTGPRVLDVGAKRPQVVPVGRTADDYQRVAVAEVGAHRREAKAPEQQLALVLDVLDRVAGELRKRLVDPCPLALELLGRVLDVDRGPRGDDPAVHTHLAAPKHDLITVAQLFEQRRRRHVHESDAGTSEDQRAAIGIPVGRGAREVDDRDRPARRKVLGSDRIEVRVVDHGDVARAQALDEVLCLAAEFCGTDDRRGLVGPQLDLGPTQQRACPASQSHAPIMRSRVRSGSAQEAPRMRAGRRIVAVRAQHADDLLDQAVPVDTLDRRRSRPGHG